MNDKIIRDPSTLVERLIEAGEAWADLNAAADALEETKGAVLGSILREHFDEPAWKADAQAKSDERYTKHIAAMVEARRKANKAKIRYDSGKAFVELARSAESTRRAEMNLAGGR
ncbi:MAG: hypothetical protein ACOY4R_27395 [Pseudomonadota bacterium]